MSHHFSQAYINCKRKARSRCLDCGHEFEHDRFHRTYPKCGSDVTMIIQGKELNIASMEVDIPD